MVPWSSPRSRAATPGGAALASATKEEAAVRGEGAGISVADWATAVLSNGLGRYDRALAAAEQASAYPADVGGPANWGLVELVKAAARAGSPERATGAMRRLSEFTSVSGTDWALGVQARSRALLSEGETADRLYREAFKRLGRIRMRAELARRICSTANGSTAKIAAPTPANSFAPPTRC
jgi:hypothetical protein